MNESLVKGIVSLKTEFTKNYSGHSHLNEVIPLSSTELLLIDKNDLNMLHKFAEKNPVYTNSNDVDILGVSCRVYEGDINQYWLDSIKHDTSYAPFYPTWILSAYTLALTAKSLGFHEVIDIGSGDGRISYCARIIGIKSYGIEIDENLVNLQRDISSSTGIDFNPINADATTFDYESLNLSKPAFFLSGLPEVGEMLANSVINKIMPTNLKNFTSFIFAGSHKMRKNSRDHSKWGWGKIIDYFGLNVIETITLPTRWTADQPIDTPYVFTISN
jgi:hypothetical protein